MDRARTTAHADELPNRRAVASGYADGPGEMAAGAVGREGTLGPRLEAFRHYRARGEQGMFAGSGGWQLRPPADRPGIRTGRGTGHREVDHVVHSAMAD